ncbi:DNRLRE domain-containing protein [candidate division KSB1 bacterium]|nr:DNRLRE domain-containing protein [candidate division KSB1 bacterium]
MRNLFTLLCLTLILASCTTERPLPTGYDQLQRQDKGQVLVQTFLPTETAHYWQTPVVGYKSTLLLGQERETRAYTVLRFYPGTSLDSTTTITSAELILNQRMVVGESGDSLIAHGYRLTRSDWQESNVTWDFISESIDRSEAVTRLSFPFDSDTTEVRAPLSTDLVKDWITAEPPAGLILLFDQADFMVGFVSTESTDTEAYLQIISEKADSGYDTTQVLVSHDATVLVSEITDPPLTKANNPALLRISNLSGFRTLLRFDLSGLPTESTIHQAMLTLPLDESESRTQAYGMALMAKPVITDSLWSLETLEVDSTGQAPVAVALGSNASVSFSSTTSITTMNSIVQAIVFKRLTYYGFLVESTDYGLDASQLAIRNEAGDSTQVPTLRVTYSLPAAPKFFN